MVRGLAFGSGWDLPVLNYNPTEGAHKNSEVEMAGKRFLDNAYSEQSSDDVWAMYEEWAATYDIELKDENDYRQPDRCAGALADVISEPAARVLDLGCGTGLSGLALRARGFTNIDGCDFSPAMLEKAKLTGAYGNVFEADLNQPLAVDDAAYDAATAVGVFSYSHVKPSAIDEILRVIRPGAPLVIGINDKFHASGSLTEKFSKLEAAGAATLLKSEHGDHIPGIDLQGWIFVLRKA